MTGPPTKKPPKAPPSKAKAPPQADPPANTFSVTSGVIANRPQKVCVFGPGGVGKSSFAELAKMAGRKPLMIDLERGSGHLDVDRIDTIETWEQMLSCLRDKKLWQNYDLVCIDSFTMAEDLCLAWTLENVPNNKGEKVAGLEFYGWGSGATHMFETFLQLISALDQHVREGRSVLAICHDCTSKVPNPSSDDYLRFEPRMSNSSRGNIRSKIVEWVDHMLFVSFDVYANKEGKATGSGTRTIYPQQHATHIAKSRTLSDELDYIHNDPTIWNLIFNNKEA